VSTAIRPREARNRVAGSVYYHRSTRRPFDDESATRALHFSDRATDLHDGTVVEAIVSRSRSSHPMLRLGAVLSLIALACAPATASSHSRLVAKHVDEIPQAEIEAASMQFGTAYDIVRALRPTMVTSRGTTTARSRSQSPVREADHGIKVYLDGIRYGGVESLATIPANAVREIRWLSAGDATIRYGTGNVAGAIVVATRDGRR
jgi:hypothetical protein